jgi:hypothetical protein
MFKAPDDDPEDKDRIIADFDPSNIDADCVITSLKIFLIVGIVFVVVLNIFG